MELRGNVGTSRMVTLKATTQLLLNISFYYFSDTPCLRGWVSSIAHMSSLSTIIIQKVA